MELINEIERLLNESGDFTLLSNAIDSLFEHTLEHFRNEEILMKEVNFPVYSMHKTEHDRVLNEFQFIALDWRNQKDNEILRRYFTEDVPAWLSQHIASMDTVTAQFIAAAKMVS